MQTNSEQMPPNEAANGAANSTQETGGALRVRLGVQPRTFQKVWKRTFGYAFESGRIVTPSELQAMEEKYLKQIEEKPEPKPRAKAQPKAVCHTAKDSMSHEEQVPVNVSAPQKVATMRRWPLWAALIITAGASVPNMVEVTTAIKGSGLVAWSLTACFTFVPFLLIMARVGGWAWPVVIGVMAYTCFCNTAAIFGGLTALDTGYILKPTVFLEATTNLLNTDYLNTARVLAFLMSVLIGWIELVSFKKLAQ
jgi:hypothetical protein